MTRRFWPPLVAFVLQRAVLAVVAWTCSYDPFAPSSWVRRDSGYYLSIAVGGYQPLAHCPPGSPYPPTAWCGNSGWFPGYPWLLAQLPRTIPVEMAAVLLSAVAQLGCLVLVWRLLNDDRQWPALGVAAFFLGNVYMAAVFPISLFLLAALACLSWCWSGKFQLAAAAGAFAATCYPTGLLLAPVVFSWALLRRRWRALLVPAGVVAGYAAVLWQLHRQAGAWDAFLRVQHRYEHSWDALDTLGARFKPLVNARFRNRNPGSVVTALQTLLSAVLISVLGYDGCRSLSSERTSLVLLYLAAFWLAPLTVGGNVSLYRSEALLLPAVLLLPSFPRWLQFGLLVVAVLLSIPMAALFFRDVLV